MSGLLEKIGIGNPWALVPFAVIIPAVFMAGGMWDADGREDRATRKAAETTTLVTLACMTDKAQAWEEVRNSRTEKFAQAAQFDRIMGAGEAERIAFRTELKASQAQSKRSRDEAAEIMKRLDDARSELAKSWREGRIPADVTCGVLHTPGCPGIPGPAAGAANRRDQQVPSGPSGRDAGAAGPAGGAAVSGSSANRPGDL